MQKFTKKLMVFLVLLGGTVLPSKSMALFGFGNKKKTLASNKEVASKSGPVTSWSGRLSRTIMKNINPCHGPSCVSPIELKICAEAKGLSLATYLQSDEEWFYVERGKPKYVTVPQRDLDLAGWQASHSMYQQAREQYEALVTKGNDIQNLRSRVSPDDEDGRMQIQQQQEMLQEMQQGYLLFLGQNNLLDIEKFMQQQQQTEAAMSAIGGGGAMAIPRAAEPKPTDSMFVKVKNATVRVMNRDVWVAIQEFAGEERFCFETFCYHNCLEDALYTGKDVRNYLTPEEIPTMKDVNRMRALFVIKRSDACSGESTAASKLRALCSYCKEGAFGKNVQPIEACSNVHPDEWETKKKQGFGGMGMFG